MEETLKPLFIQVAEWIEDGILDGTYQEETQVPSTNQLSTLYHMNPATAGKGLNLLVDEGILYKKRGIGMFVNANATKQIKEKRKKIFLEQILTNFLEEADKLDISREEIIAILKQQ